MSNTKIGKSEISINDKNLEISTEKLKVFEGLIHSSLKEQSKKLEAECIESNYTESDFLKFDAPVPGGRVFSMEESDAWIKWVEEDTRRATLFNVRLNIKICKYFLQSADLVTAQIILNCINDNFLRLEKEKNSYQRKALIESICHDARKSFAQLGAAARHVETRKKREEIKTYCREYLYSSNPKLSCLKAAERLFENFPDISFPTLYQYATQAKKEMKNLLHASNT